MEYHAPEQNFPAEISSLTWPALQDLARYHTNLAESLQKRAARLRGIALMEDAAKQMVEELSLSYRPVMAYLDKGYNSLESAVAAAARDLSLPEETIMGWWKIFIRNRDRAQRTLRDEFIIRQVQAGYKNSEIAARMDVHENTVSRAISGHLHGGMRPCDRARLRKRRKPASS